MRRWVPILGCVGPNRSWRRASEPHAIGDRSPAGGGHQPGHDPEQVAEEFAFRRPVREPDASPGRTTLASSPAARSCEGANITLNVDSATSKEPSSKGSGSASATWNVMGSPSASARRWPCSRSSGRSRSRSRARTVLAASDALPLPAATVDHALAGVDADRLAQGLPDHLEGDPDAAEVARGRGRFVLIAARSVRVMVMPGTETVPGITITRTDLAAIKTTPAGDLGVRRLRPHRGPPPDRRRVAVRGGRTSTPASA